MQLVFSFPPESLRLLCILLRESLMGSTLTEGERAIFFPANPPW